MGKIKVYNVDKLSTFIVGQVANEEGLEDLDQNMEEDDYKE